MGIAGVAQLMIADNARTAVRRELAASGAVYDRIWALRARSLGDTADVLARDFGFREAVASGDTGTIRSALANLGARAGVSATLLVDLDGNVVGAGDEALRRAAAAIPVEIESGRGSGVVVSGGRAYRAIVTPVLAPVEIGWIVFAVSLDEAELRDLSRLSAIPLDADLLVSREDGRWLAADGRNAAADLHALLARALAGEASEAAEIGSGTSAALALVKPLPAPAGAPRAALLLRYPLTRAMAPFRPLQLGILIAGLIALLVVIVGSLRLARTIARPIRALDRAAQALEAGARTEVTVDSQDEVGRLAASFNAMARGIFEREDRITQLAFNDTLTGLPNRSFFREHLTGCLKRRGDAGEPIAVLCINLDRFKLINETHGHAVGDAVLQAFGRLLTAAGRGGFAARLGADEFGLLLSEGIAPEAVRGVAQEILDRLRTPIRADGHNIELGASIGIAMCPGDGVMAELLLKHAELALTRAKQEGRSTMRFFEAALDAAARDRRSLELDLRQAIGAGQLRLAFQPIFTADGSRVVCFEALLRWHHPTRGLVGPDQFIPIAEESGLIVPIGEWVLHQACREAAAWNGTVRVAVNVSPRQFRSAGFQAVVTQALAQSGVDPRRLEIEITESAFLDSGPDTLKLLHSLRALGIRIALDDFGTGYSSLGYLRSFPFDKIKIDKSFVDGLGTQRSATAIVRAIVDLAGALGMDTTAEGVENGDQLRILTDQGCRTIQGYLLGKPMDGPDALALGTGELCARAA